MTVNTQLLIYRDAVPVSRERHQDWYVETGNNFSFGASVNSVPLMAAEFPLTASECPIVFGGTENEHVPAAILGVRGEENLFIAADGTWSGKYIPAFLRRYPFVFSHSADRLVLCVDEAFPGFNREGRGQRLFAEDGTISPYVTGVLNFLQDYQVQFNATRQFCDRVKALGLLEPMQAEVKMDGGETTALSGFSIVNRDRLKALPAETLQEMAKSDELELIYLHLHSMRHFNDLGGMLARRVRH